MDDALSADGLHVLVHRVVRDVVGSSAQVEPLEPTDGWPVRVRIRSEEAVCELDSSPSVHMARFPALGINLPFVSEGSPTETNEILVELARVLREYLAGRYVLRAKRWGLRSKPTLFLTTEAGDWEIARRVAVTPRGV